MGYRAKRLGVPEKDLASRNCRLGSRVESLYERGARVCFSGPQGSRVKRLGARGFRSVESEARGPKDHKPEIIRA